jgi:hypothetical protein
MCIFFYCSSKVYPHVSALMMQVVIYLFLIERVHIVRGRTRARLRDKLYLFHLGGLIPYCVIVVLAIIFRINQLNETGRCYIGLRRESSFLLLIYDLVINVFPPRASLMIGIPYWTISTADIGIVFFQTCT